MSKHILFENNKPLVERDYFDISCRVTSEDYKNLVTVINQGIDARLTGFTKSFFQKWNDRFYFYVELSELEILIRRLLELETEDSERLADDIVLTQYGKEII